MALRHQNGYKHTVKPQNITTFSAGAIVLKVNLPYIKGSLSPASDVNRAAGAGKTQGGDVATPKSGSQVALSSTARHLAQLSDADQDINIVRVNEIRNALADGTLKINPERIADSLIASARELLTKK